MSIIFTTLDYIWIGLLIAAVVVFVIWLISRRSAKLKVDEFSQKKITEQWDNIEKLVNDDTAGSWKLAVMEADKLVDYVFKSLGLPGQDFGQRLKAASYNFPKIRQVWPAHRVRNRLVHETDYQINKRIAKQAVGQFKNALRTLRVL